MTITKVQVRMVEANGRIRAKASITLDDVFVVNELRLIDGSKGLFLAMPSRKGTDGKYRDIAHPIDGDFRKEIEKAVMEEYNRQLTVPSCEE